MQKILLIDDQKAYCEQIQKTLALYNIPIEFETNANDGLSRALFEEWDAVLLDVILEQELDGIVLLKEIINKKPQLPVIMISGSSTLQTAVEATKMGAYDFLEKPLDLDRLQLTILRAIEKNQLTLANQALLKEISKQSPLVGKSKVMAQLINEIDQFAPTSAKVFIHGESGVGKDLLAKVIHYHSNRKTGPLVSINCSAIPEQLIESELFGYEKGAFTGANERKTGLIAQAEGGTLFLDEISELPPSSQAKLLRFLQSGEYTMLGSTTTIHSDVRIISATNRDIHSEIKNGHFREDLFYRLNVVNLSIPPLRNRREDIPPLAEFFLRSACDKFGKKVTNFSKDALQLIYNANWPGNVRQLKSAVYRMVIFTQSNLIDYGTAAAALQMDRTLEETVLQDTYEEATRKFEKLYFLNLLNLNNWNLRKVSEQAGLSEEILISKLQHLKIQGSLPKTQE